MRPSSLSRRWIFRGLPIIAGLLVAASTRGAGAGKPKLPAQDCRAAVFEGEVVAGQPYRKVFIPGLELFLEPLRSGWIIRVLEMRGGTEVRGPHDWAEVATPPYRSVSPLLISTDWAFRAQDAAGWNPREFRYTADHKAFLQLSGLVDRIAAGDPAASVQAASLVIAQPEARLQILDVALVPGTRNQALMAATVASHFLQTPHTVVQGESPTPLGRLQKMKFRVTIYLSGQATPATGLELQRYSCKLRPTG